MGTWVEETDLRPTLLSLVGLRDDYQTDGRVITQALTHVPRALQGTQGLAAAYQQLNSSVGAFATDTLIADSAALASGSASDDSVYQNEQASLARIATARDKLAAELKAILAAAANGVAPSRTTIRSDLGRAQAILNRAHDLAANI